MFSRRIMMDLVTLCALLIASAKCAIACLHPQYRLDTHMSEQDRNALSGTCANTRAGTDAQHNIPQPRMK